ncbi:IQ and ubiquitin-like domain-containing protein [Neocloeon triangulifer]|uniref:IQ and ubiquitin-like domain-containing protein n=1 Tax=Neocloeon triangulifer TaxID=2078957 RepID=UPI00286F7E51|nr:IQ and ubiquitin-like domain-containing protein [Neocloeon triangulifer]
MSEKSFPSSDAEDLPSGNDEEASEPNEPQQKSPVRVRSSALSVVAVKEEYNTSVDDKVIFVKLWLPQGVPFTLTSYRSTTVFDLLEKVALELYIPSEMLILVLAGEKPQVLQNMAQTLSELLRKNDKIEIYVNCIDPDVDLEVPDNLRARPTDILTVIVTSGIFGEQQKMVVVEIEHDCRKKEFLGGYRCKKTGREYYHAASQTQADLLSGRPKKLKRSRKVQTRSCANFEQQTPRDGSTQTGGAIEGRLLTPKAPRAMVDVVARVVLIQRMFRGWRVRRGLQKIREEAVAKQELKLYLEQDAAAGRYNPTTFEVLYQLVERWRKRCLDYAFATKTQGPSRADFQNILEMQVNMLAVIEKERVKMREKRLKERQKQLLDEICSPVKWKSYNGLTISMETTKNQRASQLRELHDKLFAENLNTAELKENLQLVREALLHLNEPKKNEVLQLVDREAQLLEMGLKMNEIKNLHLRLEKSFSNLIRDPRDCKKPKSKLFLCNQCRKMLPPKLFVIPLTRPEIKVCTSCQWIDNMSHGRVDHGPFALMLKELQQQESRRGCYRSMAFVLEVHDIKYLVDQIWHGQSAISQNSNLDELRLGRWDITKEWSPWNTILLSRKELQEHLNIMELNLIYGEEFIKNINIKHLIAQMHFKGLHNLK